MSNTLIPSPDTIPLAWGWFQFLLLLTFPLHLLAMNSMLGGLAIGLGQHLIGGEVRKQLSHRIAIALPLVIAFVVNLGVAPLLFLQVLYGQFIYTSSILMGVFWILIIPILIIGYYGAYLYDFKYARLGRAGIVIGLVTFSFLLCIGYFFSNNMLLMTLPAHFSQYFSHMAGNYLISSDAQFLPRYFHMMCGSLAVGGLFVAALGRFRSVDNPELAAHSLHLGMNVFSWLTCFNLGVGIWYLMYLERDTMFMFMGGNLLATLCFVVALGLAVTVIITGFKKKLLVTIVATVVLVYLMSFMRAWERASYLEEYFQLGDLRVVAEYSPFIFFLVTLIAGVVCVVWMLRLTYVALRN